VEALEHPLKLVAGDARSRVLDAELNPRTHRLGTKGDRAVSGGVSESVPEEVAENLRVKEVRISDHERFVIDAAKHSRSLLAKLLHGLKRLERRSALYVHGLIPWPQNVQAQ